MKKCIFALCCLFLVAACEGDPPEINLSTDVDKVYPPLAEIYAPKDGGTVPAHQSFALDYAVVRGTSGSYVEIQVDKKKPQKVALTDGRHLIEGLAPGKHRISITEYNKKGKPTGARAAVEITAQ